MRFRTSSPSSACCRHRACTRRPTTSRGSSYRAPRRKAFIPPGCELSGCAGVHPRRRPLRVPTALLCPPHGASEARSAVSALSFHELPHALLSCAVSGCPWGQNAHHLACYLGCVSEESGRRPKIQFDDMTHWSPFVVPVGTSPGGWSGLHG